MASSPTSSSQSYKYDVFLSFRGEDTRKTFVDHLYSRLKEHLIEVYKDDQKLQRGESIDESLFKAINESQIAVIIFSENYADSSWCLEELTHIMKCKDERELIVIHVFYNVEPTDVRKQKRKFGEAFAKENAKNVKADIWKNALVDVSNIVGWEPKNIADGHESRSIEKIVHTVLDKLFTLNSCIDEDLVGMRARHQDLESLLNIKSGGVRMVGIWGVGGGGKTALATSICLNISQHFQGYCIIDNVRDETCKYGLNKLQENILLALFNKEVKVSSVRDGKCKMKNMLCRRKVLILLDDVDNLDQLEALAGRHNWFGDGSRIIITTRDEHLLRTHRVDSVHPIRLFSDNEAIMLFKKYAYNAESPIEDYETLSLHFVSYASGLPLSLKVLGRFLYDKSKREWISALKRLKDIPSKEVMDILEISYDGLEPDHKEIFLNIACFLRRTKTSIAMEILEACGFHSEIGIKVLIQKALITIVNNGFSYDRFDMHDLVQEMGHDIVRRKHPESPEKHSRIWKHEEIKVMCFMDAIIENHTTEVIRHYDHYYTNEHDYPLPICNFISNMKRLRWLDMYTHTTKEDEVKGSISLSNELQYIDFTGYRISSPFMWTSSSLIKLVVLKLDRSMQEELWKGYQHLPNLKVLELKNMKKLRRTPDFSGMPCLRRLKLNECEELEEIHPSLDNNTRLEYLEVSYCRMLKRLPTFSRMKNMENLHIKSCSLKDGDMPCGIGELYNLQELNLSCNYSFTRLNFSLSQLTHLKSLNLSYCVNLLELPELPSSLAVLTANDCDSLTLVEDFLENCKDFCQVSLTHRWEWSTERLLQSMLKGKASENGCMRLLVKGDLTVSNEFTPPLVRVNGSYKLELPENWCNDFSGFIICIAYPCIIFFPSIRLSMKQVSGKEFEDDVVWEKSGRDRDTVVWYVSFGSLKHTTWWDQTYNAISFNLEEDQLDPFFDGPNASGFAVKLVDKKSRGCLTETSTDSSSHYMPKIRIKHDLPSALVIDLSQYKPT